MAFRLQIGSFKIEAGRDNVRIDSKAPYPGASGKRRMNNLSDLPDSSSTDHIITDGAELRKRARHFIRSSPWADNGVEVWVSNCIGAGILPRSTFPDRAVRQRIDDLWREAAETMDADGLLSFPGLQAQVMRSVVSSGEILGRRMRLRSNNNGFPLRIQLLEADHLPMTENRFNGRNRIIAGIELDPAGRRRFYHLYNSHPGDPLGGDLRLRRRPANEILHVYSPKRPGQLRGVSWFAPLIVKLNDLDQYDDAELVRKKTAAMFAGFGLRKPDGDAPTLAGDQEIVATDGDVDEAEAGLEAGTFQIVDDIDDIKFSSPPTDTSYESFIRVQLQSLAAGLGVTYEQLTHDLSQVNFSSIRAGLIEFRRRCTQVQRLIINHQFNRPVWQDFIRQAVLSDRLRLSSSEATQAMQMVKWVGQGFEYVKPAEDQQAHKDAVRSGFKSRSQVATELGADPEDLEDEIADDNRRADEKGLVFDSDPRKVQRSGGAQGPDAFIDLEQDAPPQRGNDNRG